MCQNKKQTLSASNLAALEYGAVADALKGQVWNFRTGHRAAPRAAPIENGGAALPIQDGPPDGGALPIQNEARLQEALFT